MSAEFFLQSIEPNPNMSMLYEFLDIYAEDFAACKDTDTYLRALSYLDANGDHALVLDRLHELERCPKLSETSQQTINKLLGKPKETVATIKSIPAPTATSPTTTTAAPNSTTSSVAPSATTPATTAAQTTTTATPNAQEVQVAQAEQATHAPKETAPEAPANTKEKNREHPITKPAEDNAKHTANATSVVAVSNAEKTQTPRKHKRVRPVKASTTAAFPSPPVRTPLQQERKAVLQAAHTMPVVKLQNATLEPENGFDEGLDVYADLISQGVYRSGDRGTGRLLRFENTALLGIENWRFSGTAVYLNAGKAPSNAFTGSYYLSQPERNLLTEQTAFIPQVAYVNDDFEAFVATTPLGGEVSPLPTFRLNYTAFDKLHISAFQESVTDSLLSYVGFTDVFTGEEMGRVVKAGAKIGWDDTFAENWFYGASVTGAHLYGENVKANNAVKGEMYIGRSIGNFAVGNYNSIDHFATNLNNYTYGHGGYYSPYIAAASVLFVSWEYKGEAGRIKADVSSGYLYEETKNSDLYYLTSGPKGEYEGKTNEHITLNTGLEGNLDLSESLSLSGSMRFIESGSFNEARGSLDLKWEF